MVTLGLFSQKNPLDRSHTVPFLGHHLTKIPPPQISILGFQCVAAFFVGYIDIAKKIY